MSLLASYILPFTDFKCGGGFRYWLNKCTDVDECNLKIQYCGSLQCQNTVGSFVCACRTGFETVAGNCYDINECKEGKYCPVNSICENTIGSFTCECESGYQGEQ